MLIFSEIGLNKISGPAGDNDKTKTVNLKNHQTLFHLFLNIEKINITDYVSGEPYISHYLDEFTRTGDLIWWL